MEILSQNRLLLAKRAFSTRRVPTTAIKTLLISDQSPKAGDLVLAKVIKLGSHKRIELPTGRRAMLFPGDEIILAYGNRYAPDQYEAYVPTDLSPCHMVAAGGVAGIAESWHNRLSGPTRIEPIGLLGGADRQPLNLKDFSLDEVSAAIPPNIFAVFGTSMNAGKSTTAAGIVKGFSNAGYKVGTAKITGTGAGGDLWMMRDFGAAETLDFTDAGYPSTFGNHPADILAGAANLLRTLGQRGCEVAIIEVADGLYQTETSALASSPSFQSLLNGTFFAAGDAMGAVSGAQHLSSLGHNMLGISGAMTRSPLAMEEVRRTANAPVFRLEDLFRRELVTGWVNSRAAMLAQATAS
ncbi:MAG: molybdopterin guanine dinucleotide synthesis B family protein [Proteobacteria bacterium]|nr:molybdopterin guanine dinucleotide synthesis B family protein [Pseudomonadota bacterium]